MKLLFLSLLCTFTFLSAQDPIIVNHEDLTSYENNGNKLFGVATKTLGADDIEVWKSSIAAHSCTPKHVHEVQEIFIFLKGEGKVEIDGKPFYFKAPCTVMCPANVPHQFFNTSDESSEQIVVLSLGSEIRTMTGQLMNLPWRE